MKCPFCKHELPTRTRQQNRGLWLFFTQLANALNESGLDMRTVLKPAYSLSWTKESVHDHLWIPIQQSLFGKKTTRELKKLEEIDKVHEILMRELGEKYSIEYIEFPHGNEIGGKVIGKNYAL